MEKIYKYRFSRRTIYWTLIYLVVFGLLGGLLYHLYEGGYLSAWFTSFIVALIALMSLSIPRYIVVTDEKVEVRCLLDITEIKRGEIASVRRGVEELRGDHRHIRGAALRVVLRRGLSDRRTHAAGRQPADRRSCGRRGGGTGGSADRKGDADDLRNAGDIRRHPICGSDGMPDRKNGPKRREYAINCIIPKSTHFLFT